jgi:hypothetical protein
MASTEPLATSLSQPDLLQSGAVLTFPVPKAVDVMFFEQKGRMQKASAKEFNSSIPRDAF